MFIRQLKSNPQTLAIGWLKTRNSCLVCIFLLCTWLAHAGESVIFLWKFLHLRNTSWVANHRVISWVLSGVKINHGNFIAYEIDVKKIMRFWNLFGYEDCSVCSSFSYFDLYALKYYEFRNINTFSTSIRSVVDERERWL